MDNKDYTFLPNIEFQVDGIYISGHLQSYIRNNPEYSSRHLNIQYYTNREISLLKDYISSQGFSKKEETASYAIWERNDGQVRCFFSSVEYQNPCCFLYKSSDIEDYFVSFKSFVGTGNSIDYWNLSSHGSIEVSAINYSLDDFYLIRNSLYPNLTSIEDLLNSYFSVRDSILLLHGPPGTGKTTALKYILQKMPTKKAAYCKEEKCIASPAFWKELVDRFPDVLFLDDFDMSLAPREDLKRQGQDTENNFVTNLLSFCDGVLSTKSHSTKVIITTNQEIKSIDPALIRLGRCFDAVFFPYLTRDQALDIWVNELGNLEETFEKVPLEAHDEVAQASLMSTHERLATDTIRNYYKNGPRDSRENLRALNGKKLGFV